MLRILSAIAFARARGELGRYSMSERTSSTIRGRDTEDAGKRQAETSNAIDAFYDRAETFVSGVGRIMNVDTSGAAKIHDERDVVTPARGIPIAAAPVVKALPAPTQAPRRFEIVEVTSVTAYEVTNGVASARFATRAEANAVLAKLREAGQ